MTVVDRPRPLPECAVCQQPVQRRANRGMCTDCAREYRAQHGEQQALPLITDAPTPRAPDLTNVVVLATRRKHP